MKVIGTISKSIGAILAVAGIVKLIAWASVTISNSQVRDSEILHKLNTVEQKVDGISFDVQELSQQQQRTGAKVEELTRSNLNLKDYMMRNAASKGDVKELMDVIKIWEVEKKNGQVNQ